MVRESKSESAREGEREREAERQADIQTCRHADMQTEKQRDKEAERERQRDTHTHTHSRSEGERSALVEAAVVDDSAAGLRLPLRHGLEDPHPSLRRHSVQFIVRRQRVLVAAHNVLRPGVVGAEVGDAEVHLDPEPVLALGLLRRESLRKLHLGWLLLVEMRSRLGGRMGVVCVLLTEAVCQTD